MSIHLNQIHVKMNLTQIVRIEKSSKLGVNVPLCQ